MKRGPRLGITQKLTLTFVLFAALLLVGVGALAYNSGRSALEAANSAELLSTANEKEAALTAWLVTGQSNLAALARLPSMAADAAALAAAAPNSAAALAAHAGLLRELQIYVGPGQTYRALQFLSAGSGLVLAATNAAEEGLFHEDQPYFIQGQAGPYVQNFYYSHELQGPAMTVSEPLRSASGQLLGVLAGQLNLDVLNANISRRSGQHQTEDAFLVNASSLFVTQPRFLSDPAVLQIGIHTVASTLCLATGNGVISADDYRGVPAIIAYRWLPERQLCLIVKVDQAEALAPSNTFGRTLLVVAGLSLAAASALAFGLARSFTRPLLALQVGAARFGQGQLDQRLPETSADELGQLTAEFNRMAAAIAEKEAHLRDYAAELEQTVLGRTSALRISEARLAGVIDSAMDAIITIDHQQRVLLFNSAAERMFQYAAADVIGGSLARLLPERFRAAHGEHIGRFGETGVINRAMGAMAALNGLRADGVEFPIEASISQVALAGLSIYTVILRDISERRRAEAVIQELNQDLELRVEQRTAQLGAANRELSEFAYVVSHDLKAPLRAIGSLANWLVADYGDKLGPDGREQLRLLDGRVRRLHAMVDSILAYSRIGRVREEQDRVDLNLLLANVLDLLAPPANIQITLPSYLPIVTGEPTRLQQVFQNLLSNAIKFMDKPSGEIRVGYTALPGFWQFQVADNGVGMEARYFDKIFQPFQTLAPRDEVEGTGIGLAVVKKVVELHGGAVWVTSTLGVGSTFYFTLPRQENTDMLMPMLDGFETARPLALRPSASA